jgi:hypothetical protein
LHLKCVVQNNSGLLHQDCQANRQSSLKSMSCYLTDIMQIHSKLTTNDRTAGMGCKITSPSCSDFVVVSSCTLISSSYKHENNQLRRIDRRTVTEKCTTEVTYITNLCNFKSMLGLLYPTLLLSTRLLKLLRKFRTV